MNGSDAHWLHVLAGAAEEHHAASHRDHSPRDGVNGVAIEGSSAARPGSAGPAVLPTFDSYNQPRHFIDVVQSRARSVRVHCRCECTLDRAERDARLRRKRSTPVGERRLDKAPPGGDKGAVTIAGAGAAPLQWKSMFSTRIGLRGRRSKASSKRPGTFRWRRNITPARLTRGQ